MHLPAEASRRVGELRWSVHLARKNYQQFGGKPEPSPLLEMLEDQDFGDDRPVVVTISSPLKIKQAERAAAVNK